MLLNADPAHCFMPYPPVELPSAATGALAGLRFAVKDLFDVAGYPTSGGNPHVLARSGIKKQTAPTVQKLLDAGARFVGKTITDELAFSMTGANAHFGTPRNGAAPDRIPGGSSSGSASAVSNALCDFALGTDTGGSVRAPASHNGLFGLRPTQGRVSLAGCLDLAPSFDTCGFFARDAATFLRVGEVLLGADTQGLSDKSGCLLARDAFALLSPDVADSVAPLLETIGARTGALTPVDVATATPFDLLYWAFRYVQGFEAWQSDGALIETFNLQLGPGVKERFAWSKKVTAAQYAQYAAIRRDFTASLTALLGNGVLLLPTMPDSAPQLSEPAEKQERYRDASIKLLCIAGLAGLPQVSLPIAVSHGAPLGLSLIGPAGSDLSLIRRGAALAALFDPAK